MPLLARSPAWLLLAGLALAGSALAASPARAQVESREGIALQNQILELRRDLDALRAQGGGGGGGQPSYTPPPSSGGGGGDLSAALLDRVTRLEDEVRMLHGQLDEEQNARQRQGEDLTKQLGDLNFKLGAGGAAAPSPRPPTADGGAPTPPPATATVPIRRTPEIVLADGNAAYQRHDYVASEAAAREVLAGGRGPRATDAQYLLANSLAQTKDWQGAAVAYDDAYRRNPKGSRAQDSLVGLAGSLLAIKENKAACETLDKARAEFPAPRADLRPSITTIRARAGCG